MALRNQQRSESPSSITVGGVPLSKFTQCLE